MRSLLVVLAVLAWPAPALALTPEAAEFLEIARKLEPVHCRKRQLRRQIVMAEAESREADARALKQQFAELDRTPDTARLEKRLAELEGRILARKGSPAYAKDVDAISLQQRQAFYRCE